MAERMRRQGWPRSSGRFLCSRAEDAERHADTLRDILQPRRRRRCGAGRGGLAGDAAARATGGNSARTLREEFPAPGNRFPAAGIDSEPVKKSADADENRFRRRGNRFRRAENRFRAAGNRRDGSESISRRRESIPRRAGRFPAGVCRFPAARGRFRGAENRSRAPENRFPGPRNRFHRRRSAVGRVDVPRGHGRRGSERCWQLRAGHLSLPGLGRCTLWKEVGSPDRST